jgi:hypothetical protein
VVDAVSTGHPVEVRLRRHTVLVTAARRRFDGTIELDVYTDAMRGEPRTVTIKRDGTITVDDPSW